MRFALKGIVLVGLLFVSLFIDVGMAWARSCDDVTAGAQRGPEVPAVQYGGAFTLPYDDACFVQWPANNRGSAGRAADKQKCRNLEGAEFLQYMPDGGRNVNICVFRMSESADGGGAPIGETEEPAPSPEIASPPSQPSTPPPATNRTASVVICNKTNDAPLYVAMSWQKDLAAGDPAFTTEGWWKFGRGECTTFTRNMGNFSSIYFYFHAASKGRKRIWGRDLAKCVSPGRFERRSTASYDCQGDEYLAKFFEKQMQPGKNTFNFLP